MCWFWIVFQWCIVIILESYEEWRFSFANGSKLIREMAEAESWERKLLTAMLEEFEGSCCITVLEFVESYVIFFPHPQQRKWVPIIHCFELHPSRRMKNGLFDRRLHTIHQHKDEGYPTNKNICLECWTSTFHSIILNCRTARGTEYGKCHLNCFFKIVIILFKAPGKLQILINNSRQPCFNHPSSRGA